MRAGTWEELGGALLILLILVDVFLTVLYARIGTGIISDHVATLNWKVFRFLSKPFGKYRGKVLSFCGPVMLVLLLFTWVFGLTVGTALVMHPQLGHSITFTDRPTPTDFNTALYIAAGTISTVGSGALYPNTPAMKLFFVWNSLVGIAVITLTLTYLMQVYSALRARNTLGLKLHILTGQTGDASELLARLGIDNRFEVNFPILPEVAAELTSLKEAHHFYPVLFYFRFREPYYAVPHNARLALDLVALIRTALNRERYRWLMESATVFQLHDAAMLVMKILEKTFLPKGTPKPFGPAEIARAAPFWREHFYSAIACLRDVSIDLREDLEQGAQEYVEGRAEWEPFVEKLADGGAFDLHEVEPELADSSHMQSADAFVSEGGRG